MGRLGGDSHSNDWPGYIKLQCPQIHAKHRRHSATIMSQKLIRSGLKEQSSCGFQSHSDVDGIDHSSSVYIQGPWPKGHVPAVVTGGPLWSACRPFTVIPGAERAAAWVMTAIHQLIFNRIVIDFNNHQVLLLLQQFTLSSSIRGSTVRRGHQEKWGGIGAAEFRSFHWNHWRL